MSGCSKSTSQSGESKYTINIKVLTEPNIEIKYPSISRGDEELKDTNVLIYEYVQSLSQIDRYEEQDVDLNGDYRIIYVNDVISIEFITTYYKSSWAYPTSYSSGLVIDVVNNKILTLTDFNVSKEDILIDIDSDNYEVASGEFETMKTSEIVNVVEEYISSGKIELDKDSFYVDGQSIYIIFNYMRHVLGDYSIIKIPKE